MVDIVDRLRQVGAFGVDGNFYEAAADEIERLRKMTSVAEIRNGIIEECVNAARDGFEASMKNYVLIGPSGMAMQMINSIKALALSPAERGEV